ncbi:MAG: glycosyltransferase family 4 protein [Candidatus Sulfobium sp.]
MSLVSGDGKGGADRIALDISTGLKELGHRVIWGSPPGCCLATDAEEAGLEIYNLDLAGRTASWPTEFVRFCRNENVDIVDGHDSRIRHLISLARLRGLRARVVSTRHCILRTVPYLGAFAHNFLADMHIAVSGVVRDSLIRSGVLPGKAVTVYGGVDEGRFENADPAEAERLRSLYTRPGAVTIGMVARLQHGKIFSPEKPTLKGHDIVFRALAGFDRDFTLLLFGPEKEEDKEKLRLIAEYQGLDPARVTFCGFQKDMGPFYKTLDLNVLPSPDEGLGLAVIEAMASGIPCIGADGGGLREIIEDGVDGFLVRPGDSGDLGLKIRIACDDVVTRKKFIANGMEKVRRRFGRERMVKETEEVYIGLAK